MKDLDQRGQSSTGHTPLGTLQVAVHTPSPIIMEKQPWPRQQDCLLEGEGKTLHMISHGIMYTNRLAFTIIAPFASKFALGIRPIRP